jgi:hypothetical protein
MNSTDIKLINEIFNRTTGPGEQPVEPVEPEPRGFRATDVDNDVMADVVEAYREGVPNDEQGGCIEAFFNYDSPTWNHIGITEYDDENSDAQGQMMFKYALETFGMPDHIRAMIEDWQENGF